MQRDRVQTSDAANINQRLNTLPLMPFQLNQNIGSASNNPRFFTILRQQF